MNNLVLDDDGEMNPNKEGSVFTFVMLVIGLFITLIFGETDWLNAFIGASLLLINGFLLYFDRRKGIIFFGLIAIAASLNRVDFLPFDLIVFITVDIISVLIFLGSYVLTNEKIFLDYLEEKRSLESKLVKPSSNMEFFKKRFKNKSTDELLEIIANPSLVEAAKRAAKELLEQKKES